MSQFTNMATKRAKPPAETKTLLLELDERARRVEEVTGEPIGNSHRMSVVMGLIDPEAMRHTAAFSGANMRADVLQKKVIEFASLMSTSSAKGIDAMDLGRLQGQRKEAAAPADGQRQRRMRIGRTRGWRRTGTQKRRQEAVAQFSQQ